MSAPAELMSQTDLRPSREQATEAVRTLIRWAGDDPRREGLVDTPERVLNAYDEFFGGYEEDPAEVLARTFQESASYTEMVILKNVSFVSHCEHHMVPVIGHAHVAYVPQGRVVGISKLARVVELYARRLQIQERLTMQIANAIEMALKPQGVAVLIEAAHQCMTTRGVRKPGVSMVTRAFRGIFETHDGEREDFLRQISTDTTARHG
ncbi:MAG: GTP cyclohydrolase I FolE [Proteobacteria bacterium]|jgi:GTP cyclohydrolase I|nr:GTP cyclohydrolase I FolE [Pseudomonadota bacterium]